MENIALSNLIKVISYHYVCSGIKGDPAKKTAISHSLQKTFDFSQNSCYISSSHFLPFIFICVFNR